MTHSLPYWLAAIYLHGIGPRTFLHYLSFFSDIKQLFDASPDALYALGIEKSHVEALTNPDWTSVENDLKWAEAQSHALISLEDQQYPSQLKEIADPPLVLFLCGDLNALLMPQIAIVGSRNATSAGLNNAEQFAYALSQAGFAITSGLALGIDAASHRGVLKAMGVTIAVSGTGLNEIYPRAHRKLAFEIMEKRGALISEFPLTTRAHAYNFPRRNRIIAGLSRGVLVVEAAIKSGSLITARLALEEGRDVFAIPGSIHQPLARGCHHLIRQGAKLVETAQDVIEELLPYRAVSNGSHQKVNKNDDMPALDVEQRQLLHQIDYEITPMDVILLRSGLTAGEVSAILLTLELNGYVESVPGGYIRILANQ